MNAGLASAQNLYPNMNKHDWALRSLQALKSRMFTVKRTIHGVPALEDVDIHATQECPEEYFNRKWTMTRTAEREDFRCREAGEIAQHRK